MQIWKHANRLTCNCTDKSPTGVQPPQPMPAAKRQAHICTEMPISVQQKRRPATHPHRATTYQAHPASSEACYASNTEKDN